MQDKPNCPAISEGETKCCWCDREATDTVKLEGVVHLCCNIHRQLKTRDLADKLARIPTLKSKRRT